jgi:selenophosphate synthase
MSTAKVTGKFTCLIPDILFDPQTSGGLVICIGEENADRLLEYLVEKGATEDIDAFQ